MNPDEIPDYPLPDPSWDYAEIWKHAYSAKAEIEKLIKFMATIEDASSDSDKEVRNRAEWVQTHIRLLLGKLPPT